MLCFDIGANIGDWSIANKDKFNRIISIEASSDTFNNYLINNTSSFDNIICLNYAVCNNNNEDVIFYIASNHQLSSLNNEWYSNKSRFANISYATITCKSITLDKLIEIYGVPDLIKIDVECGEYLTISSLSIKTPKICFEWASEMNDITFKCLDHLSELGFEKYYIQYCDNYTFEPPNSSYKSLDDIKNELNNTKSKIDWGMVWAL